MRVVPEDLRDGFGYSEHGGERETHRGARVLEIEARGPEESQRAR